MEQLPNEILIHILQYLNTYDLLKFCTVFKDLDFFLREKRFISFTDLSNRFEIQDINLCKFISVKMNPNCIKSLKINGIYWIPGHDLRRLLSKLPALEELYALDTKLGFKSEDIVKYFKLKKLAATITDERFDKKTIEASKNLTTLKHLHLKILLRKKQCQWDIGSRLEKFFCNLKYLEELWIQDDRESYYTVDYEILVAYLKNIKKVVLRSKLPWPEDDLSVSGLTRTFECIRCNNETEIIFEKMLHTRPSFRQSIFEPIETILEKAWEVFESSGDDLPCGPKEKRLLVIKEELKNIKFKELHFCDKESFCNPRYIEAARKILNTDNCRGLKKLNFGCCLFQTFDESQKKKSGGGRVSFKRRRIGVKTNITNHPFEKVAKNLKDLAELEITNCSRCNFATVIPAYSFIPNFEKLQRLCIEIPLLLDGIFLEQVFKNCKNLECLYLTINHPHELFLQNLYKYLPYAVSLKDFRLKCDRVNLENLFMSLSQIETKKVLRIYINCDNIVDLTTNNEQGLFSSFFEAQPQLIFFLLIVNQITVKQTADIQKIFNQYNKGNRSKIFYCKKDRKFLTRAYNSIPSAHNDIIFDRSRVAVIDFDKF